MCSCSSKLILMLILDIEYWWWHPCWRWAVSMCRYWDLMLILPVPSPRARALIVASTPWAPWNTVSTAVPKYIWKYRGKIHLRNTKYVSVPYQLNHLGLVSITQCSYSLHCGQIASKWIEMHCMYRYSTALCIFNHWTVLFSCLCSLQQPSDAKM